MSPRPDAEESIRLVASWNGWLREAQARLLWRAAERVPPGGRIVEIGSYQGKSTVVLARAAGPQVEVVAIDPHAGNDRGPGQWTGSSAAGESDHQLFLANLEAAGVAERVRHVREFSEHAHPLVDGSIDLLYVDGAHGYRPASRDLTEWGRRVRPGGEMFVHDVFNSAFVTLAVLRHLSWSTRWEYLGRERSLVGYRRTRVSLSGRVRNLVAHMSSIPWFARNMLIKLLRSVGLERAAIVLGHRPGDGMY